MNTTQLRIGGMHCINCDVLIERRLKSLPGIQQVKANYRRGTAEIRHTGDLDLGAVRDALIDEGYTIQTLDDPSVATRTPSLNTRRDYAEIVAAFLILFGVYLVLKQFDLLPHAINVSEQMSYGFIFLIGLVASVSSCMAATGGLLVAVAARYNEMSANASGAKKLKPLIYFNAGRLISYTLLGGAVGALGSALTLTPEVNGVLTILASAVMIVLGLQMLKLFPGLSGWLPKLPKVLSHRIHDLAAREAKGGAFLLGASTFFLPCGFTQGLQLYVLSKGSFAVGALTMFAFALGTLPALFSLSALSSFASGGFQRHFLRIAGAAVIVLGVLNIQYGLVLTGTSLTAAPSEAADSQPVAAEEQPIAAREMSTVNGPQQIIEMTVDGFDYSPHQYTVKQGVPVLWRIDGGQAAGCGRMLIARQLGIRQLLLSNGITLIMFTPRETGEFAFNCGMGMMTPNSKIIVVPNA